MTKSPDLLHYDSKGHLRSTWPCSPHPRHAAERFGLALLELEDAEEVEEVGEDEDVDRDDDKHKDEFEDEDEDEGGMGVATCRGVAAAAAAGRVES